MGRKTTLCGLFAMSILLPVSSAGALEMDKLRVQRKEVFEFAEKPTVKVEGDKVSISFAAKDFCDATVAIEDANGKILRHLASGVLGKNAPEPFQKDSLKQTVVWDGKDEIGRYVDRKERLTVRVSLGLKAQMERTLYWSGQRGSAGLVRAAPEGVYVVVGGHGDQVRLFDHEGNYVRTVYPFPADKISGIPGLKWQEFPPDNERLPSKLGTHDQDTFFPGSKTFNDILVRGDRMLLSNTHLTTLATDGSTGGVPFVKGTDVFVPTYVPGVHEWRGGVVNVPPNDTAYSPDGKWLYLAGYVWVRSWMRGGLNGVARLATDGTGKLENFAGSIAQVSGNGRVEKPFVDALKGNPLAPGEFGLAASVAVDSKGRVYAADHSGCRIRVFDPSGKLLKDIPIDRPSLVRINPRNGDIYAFRFMLPVEKNFQAASYNAPVPPTFTHLGPFDDPQVRAAYPMALAIDTKPDGPGCRIDVDFCTDPPTIWSVDDRVRLWQPEGRKLVLKRDFAADAQKVLAQPRDVRMGRPRLWFNPGNETLYYGNMTAGTPVVSKSFYEMVRIDPVTGNNVVQALPTNAEDVGFDWEGRAYLRGHDWISRFDAATWREIPFDYGEERIVKHDDGGQRAFRSASAISFAGCMGCMFHLGGFGVAPDGTMVVSSWNPNDPEFKRVAKEKNIRSAGGGTGYTPRIYPGRVWGYDTHIFDTHGKLIKDDAVPGIYMSNMVQIDRHNNVYVLVSSSPYIDGKRYFNGYGCTLIKLKPGQMKCLTPSGIIPLAEANQPKRPVDMAGPALWVEGAEWLFGPVGADAKYHDSGGKCSCYVNGRFSLDYYGRSFAPEVDRFRVVVLDTNGNVIMRIGRYGNVDDGVPLVKPDPALTGKMGGQPPTPRSVGGDEVAIMHCMNLTVHSDRRLFLADIGNQCIRSVKLGYHAEEEVALKGLATKGH